MLLLHPLLVLLLDELDRVARVRPTGTPQPVIMIGGDREVMSIMIHISSHNSRSLIICAMRTSGDARVTVTDARCGISSGIYRVRGIEEVYDATKHPLIYSQKVTLAGR